MCRRERSHMRVKVRGAATEAWHDQTNKYFKKLIWDKIKILTCKMSSQHSRRVIILGNTTDIILGAVSRSLGGERGSLLPRSERGVGKCEERQVLGVSPLLCMSSLPCRDSQPLGGGGSGQSSVHPVPPCCYLCAPSSRAGIPTWTRAPAADVHVHFGAGNRVRTEAKNHGPSGQKWANLTAKPVGGNKKSGVVKA